MNHDYWLKQAIDQPAFPNLLWSRPETRLGAGKLLIIGGHEHDFAGIARAHQLAYQAGAGTVLSILPEAVKKHVGVLAECDFLPSNQGGGFAKEAMNDLLQHMLWADMVLLPGENGRNSETAILFEQLLTKSSVPVTITRDTLELLQSVPQSFIKRSDTTLVLSLAQLQRLIIAAQLPFAIKFSHTLIQLAEVLHEVSQTIGCSVVTSHYERLIVAHDGKISSTPMEHPESWRLETSVKAAVWRMQNPTLVFEALTTAILPLNIHKN
jgi:NAD(P)H-hydrate repair Nnr-like enzyme with NAD(P)H-hydrate dehydratase domain